MRDGLRVKSQCCGCMVSVSIVQIASTSKSIANEPTKAGCGKTVLSSTIIDNLNELARKPEANIAYFYFDFTDEKKRKVEGCLRSLLRQLSAKELPPAVKAFHSRAQGCLAPLSPDELAKALKAVLQQASLTFLILDALDECDEVGDLMKKIAEIKNWKLPGVRILVTSRRETAIVRAMDELQPQSICLETALVDADIKTFVRQSFGSGGRLEQWSGRGNTEARQEIEDALAAGSNGM